MDTDALLAQVIDEASALGIPISDRIRPQVVLNTRAVARLGCCRSEGGAFTVELSARLLPAGELPVRETLAHEVLHTCRGCRDHGPRWKEYAARMNRAYGYDISRTGTWEAMGLPEQRPANYALVCQRCGREFFRARASALVQHPERYRCSCGGAIVMRGE